MQRRHDIKLQACELMCLRRVEGATRLDRMRNEDERRTLGQEAVRILQKRSKQGGK